MSSPVRKKPSQPTTFANPRIRKNRRYFRIVGGWLGVVNKVLYWLLMTSLLIFAALIVYLGLFETHSEIYASDGTVFSCHIDSVSVVRKQ